MDEYIGILRITGELQNIHLDQFLFHIDIPKRMSIFSMEMPNLQKECEEYEQKIVSYGGSAIYGWHRADVYRLQRAGRFTYVTHTCQSFTDTIITIPVFGHNIDKVPKTSYGGCRYYYGLRKGTHLVNGHNKAKALYHAVGVLSTISGLFPCSKCITKVSCMRRRCHSGTQSRHRKLFQDIEKCNLDPSLL